MAVVPRQQAGAAPLPAHLAALRDDPSVVVQRHPQRTPYRPVVRATEPVEPRVLIGRDEEPEAPAQPD
jgi:hypothetical protein